MRILRSLIRRIAGSLRRVRHDSDFSAELEAHLQSHVDDNVRAGMKPDEARRQALVALGGTNAVNESHRDQRGLPALDALLQDNRDAWRTFKRNPGFVAVVVITLALGIAVNTLVFDVVNAVTFRPLPVPDPERVVFVQPNTEVSGHISQSYPNYRDLRDRNGAFDGLIAYRISPMDVEPDGVPQRAWGYLATGNYFDVLGVQPALGRLFHQSDDQQPGAAPLAVLDYDFWQARFAANPAIVGTTIHINRTPFTVIGVAPKGFIGLELYYRPQIWVPMMMQAQIEVGNPWLERRSTLNISVAGRLKRGVSKVQAESNLNSIASQLATEHPGDDMGLQFTLGRPGFAGDAGRAPFEAFSTGLLALSALVLLVACANLASTFSARGADRAREIAIRLSIGASRGRVVRQLVTETLILSAAAGALGFGAAHVAARALSALRAPIDLPAQLDIRTDLRVFLFTFALSTAAGLLFGLAPALRATRLDVNAVLKNVASTLQRRRFALRDGLIAVQVALCFVLVSACLLSLRGLQQAIAMPIGFEAANVSMVGVELGLAGYNGPRGAAFQRRALESIASLPGVEQAAYSNTLPLNLDQSSDTMFPDVAPDQRRARGRSAFPYIVSPDFFQTLRIPLHRGRIFDSRDTRSSPRVAVVNETFVRMVLGGGPGVGQRFRLGLGADALSVEVVGVVADGKYRSLTESPQPAMFYSTLQRYDSTTTLLVRSTVPSDVMVEQIRRAIAQLDSHLPLYAAGSAAQMLALPLLPNRAAATALTAFGLLAILLAATGIHGAVAYAVSRRRREIGIRIAIGATRTDVLRLLFGRTAGLIGAGALIGFGLAVLFGPVLTQVVYLASPREPIVLAGVTAVVGMAGLTACWPPAWRSLRIHPAVALRQE